MIYHDKDVIPAVEATVKLGAGVSIDGYMLPSGEFRYGLEYISILMGRASNYYRRLLSKENLQRTKKQPKRLKLLLQKGFTAYKIKAKRSNSSFSHTISFDDFCLVVEQEAEERNPKAIALLTASFRELLRNRTHEAFNIPEDSLEKKQLDFQESYDLCLERLERISEDAQEIEDLRLPGDEDGYELISEYELTVSSFELDDRYAHYF